MLSTTKGRIGCPCPFWQDMVANLFYSKAMCRQYTFETIWSFSVPRYHSGERTRCSCEVVCVGKDIALRFELFNGIESCAALTENLPYDVRGAPALPCYSYLMNMSRFSDTMYKRPTIPEAPTNIWIVMYPVFVASSVYRTQTWIHTRHAWGMIW